MLPKKGAFVALLGRPQPPFAMKRKDAMPEKRDIALKILFTKTELEALLEKVPENVGTSTWVRRTALNQDMNPLYKRYRSAKDPDLIRQLAQINISLIHIARMIREGQSSGESFPLIKVLSLLVIIEEGVGKLLKPKNRES